MSGRPRSRTTAPSEALPWAGAASAVLVALATVLVQRRVLGAFFVPDDLIMLGRARGLVEWPVSAWRWLSGFALARVATSWFGTDPWPYHALNLACLAACAVLVARLARRWGASAPAAAAAGVLFGCSRLHFTALVAASWTSEFLSLALLLAALLAFGPGRARFVAAAALLVAALSAKESVLLVPAVLLLQPRDGGARRGAPWPQALALLATGLAAGAWMIAAGRQTGRFGGGAYETAFGRNVADSLFTLLRWAADPVTPVPDLATNPDPGAWTAGLPLLVALVAGSLALRRRAPWAAAGAAWALLALAPVLPLLHQTYLHYLVIPWAGLSLFVAGVLDAWLLPWLVRARPRAWGGERAAFAAAAALALAWGISQDHLLASRWTARLPGGDTPVDPVLRKSEYARRLVTETGRALEGRRARVAYFILDGTQQRVDLRTGEVGVLSPDSAAAFRNTIVSTLGDGTNLRVLVPNVDSVAFVRRLETSLAGFECFMPDADCHVQHLGQPPEALRRVAGGLVMTGLPEVAAPFLGVATREYPGHPGLLWMRAIVLQRTGDRERALATLRELVAVAPADSFGVMAREALRSEGLAP